MARVIAQWSREGAGEAEGAGQGAGGVGEAGDWAAGLVDGPAALSVSHWWLFQDWYRQITVPETNIGRELTTNCRQGYHAVIERTARRVRRIPHEGESSGRGAMEERSLLLWHGPELPWRDAEGAARSPLSPHCR